MSVTSSPVLGYLFSDSPFGACKGECPKMRKEILRVNQLNKMYNQDRILKDISFFVREGEIVSMIGNNGVG